MKLYLAGPMTGIADYNFPAFDAAAKQLRAAGHTVFNPAENDRENGFDATGLLGHEAAEHGFDLRKALKQDLSWICDNAEGIALLYGWEASKGARTEVSLATALGIKARIHTYWLSYNPHNLEYAAGGLPPVETVSFKLGQGIVIEPVSA
jgi:hypothetical protein